MPEKISDVFSVGRTKDLADNYWESILERELTSVGYPSRDRIFASSAGLCERQTAGMMLLPEGYEDHRNGATQFYFAIGSQFERVVERALKASGNWLDSEFRVESYLPEIPVSGRIDFVVSGDDDDVHIVELKSCGKLPSSPKEHHLAQLQVYLLLTGMRSGLLWYISRNVADYTGRIQQVVFEIKPTDEERLHTATVLARGSLYARDEKIPDIPEHMKRYKCGFCPLIPYCWEDQDLDLRGRRPTVTENMDLLVRSNRLAKRMMSDQPKLRRMFLDELGIA